MPSRAGRPDDGENNGRAGDRACDRKQRDATVAPPCRRVLAEARGWRPLDRLGLRRLAEAHRRIAAVRRRRDRAAAHGQTGELELRDHRRGKLHARVAQSRIRHGLAGRGNEDVEHDALLFLAELQAER